MDSFNEIFDSVVSSFSNYSMDFFNKIEIQHVTLISVIITLVIFILTKRSEMKINKREIKIANYEKFLSFHEDVFLDHKKKKKLSQEKYNEILYDLGRSLLVYGSKKVYKQYLCYREFQSNEISKKYAGNYPQMIMYVYGRILVQIRKELSIGRAKKLKINDSLAFYVNSIGNNPVADEEYHKFKWIYLAMKTESFFFNLYSTNPLKRLYLFTLYPIFTITYVPFKYIVMIPFGRIILRIRRKGKRNES